MAIETIVIDWEQTNYSSLPETEETFFYAFSRGSVLLYIGITKHSTKHKVKDEITQNINRFGLSTTGLSIWLGYMNRNTKHLGLRKRINDELITDAECLMIFVNQPTINEKCKKSYTGRSNLRVISNQFSLAYPTVWCDDLGNCHYSNV